DRCVRNPQTTYTIDTQTRIHYRLIVIAHAASSHWMINSFSSGANILLNIRVADDAHVRLIIATKGRRKCLAVEHFSSQLDPFAQHCHVIRMREIVRINQGRGQRILTGQANATSTLRAQLTNMNGATKSRRQLATMITQKCRQKMQLHIRSRRLTEHADKSSRFSSITGEKAATVTEIVVERPDQPWHEKRRHADGLPTPILDHDRHVQMILKIATHFRSVVLAGNADLGQMLSITHPGQHQ